MRSTGTPQTAETPENKPVGTVSVVRQSFKVQF